MWLEDTPIFIGEYRFTPQFDSGAGFGEEWNLSITHRDRPKEILGDKILRFHDGDRKTMSQWAHRFVSDQNYRDDFIAKRTPEQRVDLWYARNAEIYTMYRPIAPMVSSSSKQFYANEAKIGKALRSLEAFLITHLTEIENSDLYLRHLEIEAQEPEPSFGKLDELMVEIVADFNRVEGVKTRFSCQGLRRWMETPEWKIGPIFFPGHHMPAAHVSFEKFPTVLLSEWARSLRRSGVGHQEGDWLKSDDPTLNDKFCVAVREIAKKATRA